jgi:ATP-dependent RNA helicase RhlE
VPRPESIEILTTFTELGLAPPLLATLAAEGYARPTPIQAQAIPAVLAGRDLLGIAQTGTGKTAAFALPLLHRLAASAPSPTPFACRVLVLAPTRELAAQIAASFTTYGGARPRVVAIFGGVDMRRQERALARGADILVATPGRLADHVQQRTVRLDTVEAVVLDEVDRMLDIGFAHVVRRLLRLTPPGRQTLLFSATLPAEIAALAAEILRDPVGVTVAPVATTAELVTQRVVHVAQADKRAALASLLGDPALRRVIVFTRTKHGADRVARHLDATGIDAAAIHGNKSQGQRERALDGFRAGRTRVLVATDIAARGIDVDGISHVINFDLPEVAETYVHRIGRTARAGASGVAIALCDPAERSALRAIEALTRQPLEAMVVPGLPRAPVAAVPRCPPAHARSGAGHPSVALRRSRPLKAARLATGR